MEVSRIGAEMPGPGFGFPAPEAEMHAWSRGCPGGHAPKSSRFQKILHPIHRSLNNPCMWGQGLSRHPSNGHRPDHQSTANPSSNNRIIAFYVLSPESRSCPSPQKGGTIGFSPNLRILQIRPMRWKGEGRACKACTHTNARTKDLPLPSPETTMRRPSGDQRRSSTRPERGRNSALSARSP